ncbi:MAG: hypothetical protein ACPGQS_12680 [Bradymonadia bacterium]
MRWCRRRTVFFVVCLLVSCVDVAGDGEVVGWLLIDDCRESSTLSAVCDDEIPELECAAFDLEANFFALELFDEQSAKLRLQRGGAPLIQTDAVVIDFRDVRALRGRLGETLQVGKEQSVRAALILGRTCPSSTQSLELSGEIVIHQFGAEPGDRIVGDITFLEVRDARQPLSALLGVLRGEFDFVYQTGTPFEQFYR